MLRFCSRPSEAAVSYQFIKQARADNKAAQDTAENKKAKEAVFHYLEDKLNRYRSALPKSSAVKDSPWKYGGAWGPNHKRSYRILINSCARVIHVHCNGAGLSRAHFIHKLVEEDVPAVPDDQKKVTQKLAYGEGEFNPNRGNKLAAGHPRARVEAQLEALTHEAVKVLRQTKDSMANADRSESIIYDSAKKYASLKFQYNSGKKYLAHALLVKIAATINAAEGAGTVTVATADML
jgi:hypothetical protein